MDSVNYQVGKLKQWPARLRCAATLETSHDLHCRLMAEGIDSATGTIRGCTVMKAGVQATGKFVWLTAAGEITRDEKLAKRKIPVFTDAKTIATLMAAAKVAGKRVKMREDHDDSVGARAGFVSDFKRVTDDSGDRVAADLHVFKSYRNREVMLETAAETPEEIGLSIDFLPDFEIDGDKALMRVVTLYAVDIVDQGAVTPDGLFLSARVDRRGKSDTAEILATQTNENVMAAPTPEEIMAAVSALSKTVGECSAAIAKLAAPPAKVEDEALKAMKADQDKLALAVTAQADQLKAAQATVAQMRKERALLGFRGTEAEKAALAASSVEDIEKLTAEKKSYLQLVADRVEKEKCKKSDAHLFVMRNHSDAYREHLNSRGIRPGEAKVA